MFSSYVVIVTYITLYIALNDFIILCYIMHSNIMHYNTGVQFRYSQNLVIVHYVGMHS